MIQTWATDSAQISFNRRQLDSAVESVSELVDYAETIAEVEVGIKRSRQMRAELESQGKTIPVEDDSSPITVITN